LFFLECNGIGKWLLKILGEIYKDAHVVDDQQSDSPKGETTSYVSYLFIFRVLTIYFSYIALSPLSGFFFIVICGLLMQQCKVRVPRIYVLNIYSYVILITLYDNLLATFIYCHNYPNTLAMFIEMETNLMKNIH
jgi:hypothetical protein